MNKIDREETVYVDTLFFVFRHSKDGRIFLHNEVFKTEEVAVERAKSISSDDELFEVVGVEISRSRRPLDTFCFGVLDGGNNK